MGWTGGLFAGMNALIFGTIARFLRAAPAVPEPPPAYPVSTCVQGSPIFGLLRYACLLAITCFLLQMLQFRAKRAQTGSLV